MPGWVLLSCQGLTNMRTSINRSKSDLHMQKLTTAMDMRPAQALLGSTTGSTGAHPLPQQYYKGPSLLADRPWRPRLHKCTPHATTAACMQGSQELQLIPVVESVAKSASYTCQHPHHKHVAGCCHIVDKWSYPMDPKCPLLVNTIKGGHHKTGSSWVASQHALLLLQPKYKPSK